MALWGTSRGSQWTIFFVARLLLEVLLIGTPRLTQLDDFSRRILAWALQSAMRTGDFSQAIEAALRRRAWSRPVIGSASAGDGPWTGAHLARLWPVSGDQRAWARSWPLPTTLRRTGRLSVTTVLARSAFNSSSGRRPESSRPRSRTSSPTTTPSDTTRPWAMSRPMMCTLEDTIRSTQKGEG